MICEGTAYEPGGLGRENTSRHVLLIVAVTNVPASSSPHVASRMSSSYGEHVWSGQVYLQIMFDPIIA